MTELVITEFHCSYNLGELTYLDHWNEIKTDKIIANKFSFDMLYMANLNSNHLLIPNAHTTNILSNKCNMAILGYHQDKVVYKLV